MVEPDCTKSTLMFPATFVAGKLGNAVQLTAASSQSLSRVDNASLSTGDIDFWVAGWALLDSKGAIRVFVSKNSATGNQREWQIFYDSATDRFIFRVSTNGTTTASVSANNLGSPSTATWYFVLAWHDSVSDTINIRVNGGTVDSTAHSAGVFDSTADFRIGSAGDATNFWDGKVDSVSFGKNPPGGVAGVISEISSQLYNSGSGRDYPFA